MLLFSVAAYCLSLPESVVSDYPAVDHWNVLRRLSELLSAASFITANATVIAKHWFCCLPRLLFGPVLCVSQSPVQFFFSSRHCYAHLFYFPRYVGVIFSSRVRFSIFHLNCAAGLEAHVFLAIAVNLILWTNTVTSYSLWNWSDIGHGCEET